MYSKDYKKRTLEYRKEGHKVEEVIKTFKIAKSTFYEWAKEVGKRI